MAAAEMDRLSQHNYATWEVDMKFALMSEGCFGHVTGSEEKPGSDATSKEKSNFQHMKEKTMSILYYGIEQDYRDLISSINEPVEAWNILKEQFQPKSRACLMRLFDQFFRESLIPGEPIGIFVTRLKKLVSRIKDFGHTLTDVLVAFQAIRALPEHFRNIVQALYRLPDEQFNIKVIETELIAVEDRISQQVSDEQDRNSSRDSKRNVICYFASWANYRLEDDGNGKYVIEDIDPLLCTHAVYSFAKLENNSIAVFDSYLDLEEDYGLGGYKRFNDLKQKNPQLKTLISIGGWNEGSIKYSQMAAKAAIRATFVESVITFLDKYGFSGLDVDWEYPGERGGELDDKQNFVLLLKDLHAALKTRGYLLTAAVAAGKSIIDTAYDIPQISGYLDLIHVMTYDFHGAWGNVTGINAPLYAEDSATQENKEFTVDYAIRYWIDGGAPKEKLVLGVGFYGRSFTLKDASQTRVGAPTVGNGGEPGIYTNQTGLLGFNEICLYLTQDTWTEKWYDTAQAPYAYKGDQWVSYDNKQSIEVKMDYIKEKGLSGALIWSVDTDDFRGTCYGQKHYLLSALTDRIWN